jgi:hypothetical protein
VAVRKLAFVAVTCVGKIWLPIGAQTYHTCQLYTHQYDDFSLGIHPLYACLGDLEAVAGNLRVSRVSKEVFWVLVKYFPAGATSIQCLLQLIL